MKNYLSRPLKITREPITPPSCKLYMIYSRKKKQKRERKTLKLERLSLMKRTETLMMQNFKSFLLTIKRKLALTWLTSKMQKSTKRHI